MIANFDIQDFDLSPLHPVIPLFGHFMTGFYE